MNNHLTRMENWLKQQLSRWNAPVEEDDWALLEKALNQRDRKRNKLWILGSLVGLLVLSSLGIGLNWCQSQSSLNGEQVMDNTIHSREQQVKRGAPAMGSSVVEESQFDIAENHTAYETASVEKTPSEVMDDSGSKPTGKQTRPDPKSMVDSGTPEKVEAPGLNTNGSGEKTFGNVGFRPLPFSLQNISGGWHALNPGKLEPTGITGKKENDKKTGLGSAVYVSLGMGMINSYRVYREDPEQVHRGYSQREKEAATRTSFTELSFGFRRKVVNGFQVRVGAEYNRQSTNRSFHFKNLDIPVYDTLDKIVGYIELNDTGQIPYTSFQSMEVMSSLRFQIDVEQSVQLGNRFRTGIGISLSPGWQFRNATTELNRQSLEPYNPVWSINRFQLNYQAMAFLEYRYSQPWGFQLQIAHRRMPDLYQANENFQEKRHSNFIRLQLIRYL